MFHVQGLQKLIVFIAFSLGLSTASAGSYEDFFDALKADDVTVVRSLLQRGFDPNTVNPQGVPALMMAVLIPSLQVAELLVRSPQIRVEVRNAKDESVLMLAAIKGYLPLVQQLVAKDADVNKTGWTPLHYAASGGHVAVMSFLLDHSAYIDAESPNGTTPLMMAARYGSPEAVKLLIQEGADPTLSNQLGLTAKDFAVQGRRQNSIELMDAGLARWAARQKSTTVPVQPNRWPSALPR